MPQLNLPEAPAQMPHAPRRRPPARKHGGAWKVAYADFVTALMALFIVLWLLNSSEKVKASVTGYFHDPRGYTRRLGAGLANAGEGIRIHKQNVADVRQQIEQALRQMPDFEKLQNNVKFSVTGEGLRIELLENEQGTFFEMGSPAPTTAGQQLLGLLAREIRTMPNSLVIEGHTDARPFRNAAAASGYSNWELSVDRANAARRLLHTYGLRNEQVVEVRGFADQKLMNSEQPEDARNRRISIVVRFPATGE